MSTTVSVVGTGWRAGIRPALIGLSAAALFVLVYLGIVGVASRSFNHALQQLKADALMIGPLTAGLGLQIGLYAYYRQLQRDVRRARPALAVTAAGTGTSTVTMIACCAHHVSDVLPLVGLTAAATFLTEFRTPFIVVGIVSNLIGVAVVLRLVLAARKQLREVTVG
ncbi:MAG: hypothetical protein ACRDH2_12905 [Anaerolineales bacterium]